MEDIGRMLVLFGVVIVILGGVIWLLSRFSGIGLGRLPGDIVIQQGNFSCFFPIVTSIILSLILTIVLNLLLGFLRR